MKIKKTEKPINNLTKSDLIKKRKKEKLSVKEIFDESADLYEQLDKEADEYIADCLKKKKPLIDFGKDSERFAFKKSLKEKK